jgi:hypothetical protein
MMELVVCGRRMTWNERERAGRAGASEFVQPWYLPLCCWEMQGEEVDVEGAPWYSARSEMKGLDLHVILGKSTKE